MGVTEPSNSSEILCDFSSIALSSIGWAARIADAVVGGIPRRAAQNVDRPRIGFEDPQDHPYGRGLARPVGPDDALDAPLRNLQIDGVDGGLWTKFLGHALQQYGSSLRSHQGSAFLDETESMRELISKNVSIWDAKS